MGYLLADPRRLTRYSSLVDNLGKLQAAQFGASPLPSPRREMRIRKRDASLVGQRVPDFTTGSSGHAYWHMHMYLITLR
jgi:hypothetical protein